jgi:hypothetical protein
VISVAFSSLLGLSLKNGFDYYYSAIPDYFYPCYPLCDHSKILSFHLFYAPLLFHGAGLLDLHCCRSILLDQDAFYH